MSTLAFRRRAVVCALGSGLLLPGLGLAAASSTVRVEVVGVGGTRIPVSLGAFDGDVGGEDALHEVLQRDFDRSGLLQSIRWDGPAPQASVADAWVRGHVETLADGRLRVQWSLWDTLRAHKTVVQEIVAPAADRRLVAHRIADTVQDVLCGVRGVNATRIAFVVQEGPRYLLKIADSDGARHRVALASRQAIISPAWSPDGKELAYVSFEAGQAQVWVQEVLSGRRRVLAACRGSNSAPAWSPDGRQLALALSRDGQTQLFLLDRSGGAPRRLTHSTGIDTEPAWTPDGRTLLFVSDRGGSPQIYRLALDSDKTERLTFDHHSVSPAVSVSGRHLAYVSSKAGAFRLMLKDLESGSARALTDSKEDERPSFAPNGRLIVYATREGGRDHLLTTTLDGAVRTRLLSTGLDVREPAWGPWLDDPPGFAVHTETLPRPTP